MRAIATLTLLSTSCASPASDSAAEVEASQSTSGLQRIAADRRQFEVRAPGVLGVDVSGVLGAELTSDGLVAWSGADEVFVETVSVSGVPLGGVEPRLGGCAPSSEVIGGWCAPAAERDFGEVVEWWTSSGEGIQQGWTIPQPVDDADTLTLRLEVSEVLSIDADGTGATLVGSTGQPWRYEDLIAWDAHGTIRNAHLTTDGPLLAVVVDVERAAWPITIDPKITTYDETRILASDGSSSDYFGYSVSDAGDIDGDGYEDIIVGASHDDDSGYYSGSVYLYYGTPTGISTTSEDKLTASDGTSYHFFGISVSGAGDVDGDGYSDVVVGAYGDEDNGVESGSAYVYYGTSTGISTTSEDKITASDGGRFHYFGMSVSGAGDVDGDGYDDIVVGAYKDNDSGYESGSAYVYYGTSTGISATSEDKVTASDGASGDYFGWAVSGAGDVDGDGYDDIVIGVLGDNDNGTYSGSVYVYYGTSTGISASSEGKVTASDGAAYDRFGRSVSGAGDVDDDGYDDIIVGAFGDDSTSGSVYVYHGTSAGISATSEDKITASDGAFYDYFGISVSGAGDVGGDGYDDVVVGANEDDDNGPSSGSVYVYSGGCLDVDGDGYCVAEDCDDTDATINPGAVEVIADSVDQNCDGAEVCYADSDGDGYAGDSSTTSTTDLDCTEPGEGSTAEDCDDSDPNIHPDAAEVCDSLDNDCDGDIDDDDGSLDTSTGSTFYADVDGDGFGSPDVTTMACEVPEGHAADSLDCDDSDASINPGATELVGDEVDQDCDGAEICYADEDGDGFANGFKAVVSADTDCTDAGEGALDSVGDCNDHNPDVFPGAEEVADDGVDQDCDGSDLLTGEGKDDGCSHTSAPAGRTWLPLALLGVIGLRRRAAPLTPIGC